MRRPGGKLTIPSFRQSGPVFSVVPGADHDHPLMSLSLDDLGIVRGQVDQAPTEAIPVPRIRTGRSVVSQLQKSSPLLAEGLVRALDEEQSFASRTLFSYRNSRRLIHATFAFRGQGDFHVLELSPVMDEEPGLDAHLAWAEGRDALLSQVLHLLTRDLEISRTAPLLLQLLAEGLDMESGALFVSTGERTASLLSAFGRTRQRGFPYDPLDLRDPLMARMLRRPQMTVLDPADSHQPPLAAVLPRDFGYGILVPAVSGNTLSGVVVLSRKSSKPLGFRDLNLLRATGQTLGLVLGNRALSTESRRSNLVLETAYAVSRAISRSLDLEQTFREIASNAARIVQGSSCLLLELDADSGELVAVASSEEEETPLAGLRIRFEDDLSVATELSRPRTFAVDDLVWGARVSPEMRAHLRMQTAMFLPMLAKGAPVGALLIYTPDRRERFTEAELARAEDVAEQAAGAIQNALLYRNLTSSQARIQALLARIARIREQERQTFASLVHDDIVQTIVGAVYELQAIRADLPSEVGPEFDRIVEILRRSIKDARRIIWELRPPVLDQLGLQESLRALAERLNEDTPPRVRVSAASVDGLGHAATTALYKVAREALLNARRHAGAEWVELRLWQDEADREPRICLQVRDNGLGFDPALVDTEDHYGLAMMEEQAAVVGGALEVVSKPGVGTSVTMTVCLEGET